VRYFGRHLAAALTLLAGLAGLQWATGPIFSLIVSGVLVALPVLQWATVYFFWQRSILYPEILTLRIRVQDALYLALASSMAGALGIIAIARVLNLMPPVGAGVFLVGLSFSLVMVAFPALNWLVTWKPWQTETVAQAASTTATQSEGEGH